jgi:uncharacterized protein (TIGR00369 family)
MSESTVGTRTRTIAWEDPRGYARQAVRHTGLEWLRLLLDGSVPPPPIAALLGFAPETVEEGRVVFVARPAEYHYNPIGTVHGGLAATLLDSAMGCAVHSTLPAGVAYGTIDLQVRYTRPMTADTGPVRCEATVVHSGTRLATAEGRLTDGRGRLLAHGTTSCLLTPVPS